MQFCQVIQVGEQFAVIAPSRWSSVSGASLATFPQRYHAEGYARQVNALARCFRGGRARDAKEKA